MKRYHVAIVGAGPAGMMAAIAASRSRRGVVLIDRNPELGRKLLATGNGRCNLTNRDVTVSRYHGADPLFIETVLVQFDERATMAFFADLGLLLKEEDEGRIFPRTNQASGVVEVMRQRLLRAKVRMLLGAQVTGVEKLKVWRISLADGTVFEAEKLILATGGWAANQFGSTGDGLHWARKLGLSVTPVHPALVPVETVEQWTGEVHGVRVEARVRASTDSAVIGEKTGDVLFTNYGLSGTAVMALAGAIAPLLKKSEVRLHIDLFPDMETGQLQVIVVRSSMRVGTGPSSDALIGLIPSGLIAVVLRLAGIEGSTPADDLSREQLLSIAATMKDLTLTVSKLRPFKEAQVTAGGVDTSEIDPRSLQSWHMKGLYFAGEILDVDGDSGGFNLQWAWSSGYVAGMSAGEVD